MLEEFKKVTDSTKYNFLSFFLLCIINLCRANDVVNLLYLVTEILEAK